MLLGAGILLVALTGCAATPAPAASTPAAAPSATEAPVALDPQSTLLLGCAELLSLDDVQQRLPGTTLAVAVDEASTPNGEYWAGFATAGGLRCVWAGEGRTDGGYDEGLQLSILGDAQADYDRWLTDPGLPQVAWVDDAFGDRSHTFCADEPENGCFGGVLVDDYWIDVSLRGGAARTATVANERLSELLQPVVDAIRGAGPARPGWTPPATAYAGDGLCDDAAVASDVVGTTVTLAPRSIGGLEQLAVGFSRGGVTSCTWSSRGREFAVYIFPGGAWIFSRFAADPDEASPGYLSAAQPTTIDGAEGALTAQADIAWSAMSVGGSLVILEDLSSGEPDELTPALERIAALAG
jgi:hypothetical protein